MAREGPEFQHDRTESPASSWKSYGVIPEIDIRRAATLMLKRYGEKAREESAARVDELATAGDDDGVAVRPGSRTPSGNSPTPPRPARSTDLPRRWRARPDVPPSLYRFI